MQELLIDIDPTYMKIWNYKKIFIKQTLFFSINFIKVFIRIIKYILKLTLKYMLKNIVSIMPLFLKKRIIAAIYCYPNIVVLLKKLRVWIKRTARPNEVFPTNYIMDLYVKIIFFPILKFALNHKSYRLTIIDGFKKNLFIKVELEKIINKEIDLIEYSYIDHQSFYIDKNSELSYTEQEIYRDFKIHSITN